ncbi:uncharacterized protein LOC107013221 [Solanum pennellii]|uniref:Uncharacterized protein LOC107013221 n=1 Tax=Solanum pennellii TaxID=28526 RepID=A0ABM1GBH7_SOLPN|nr:uncharacterized protein LOC107013221 [Solanum pennellii]
MEAKPLMEPGSVFPQDSRPPTWCGIIQLASCIHVTKVQNIAWTRTPRSAIDNPGKIGARGILIDHEVNLILVFTLPLGSGTNNQEELGATIFGISWALEQGYRKIILEMDSMLAINWILQKLNLSGAFAIN